MKFPQLLLCLALLTVPLRGATTADLLSEFERVVAAELQAMQAAGRKDEAAVPAERIAALREALARLHLLQSSAGEAPLSVSQMVDAIDRAAPSGRVHLLAAALSAQIKQEANQRWESQRLELEAIGKRCAEQGVAAKTAGELDAPLSAIAKALSTSNGRYADETSRGTGLVIEQLQVLQRYLQTRQDYFVKMEAGNHSQALSTLRQGGSSVQVGTLPWVPRSVLLATSERDLQAAMPVPGRLEAAAKKLGAKILEAKTAKEIDPLLEELGTLQESARQEQLDGGDHSLMPGIASTFEFARHWQEFLAAREAGSLTKARALLTQLTTSSRDYPGVPRSEILARANGEDTGEPGGKKGAEPRSTFAAPEVILSSMKTLDDLDRLLPEFAAASEVDRSAWSKTQSDLQSIASAYHDLRAGNAARVSLGLSGFDGKEPVPTLRAKLALYAAPRIIGAAEADQPRPEENAATYLRRMLELARERKDWRFAARIFSAAQSTQINDPLLSFSQASGLESFLAGLNLEKGRQYSLAVNAFQIALKTGSEVIPADEIGEHLEMIKRDHPADYESGLQLTINPPAPRTDPLGRPMTDPRTFPGGMRSYPRPVNPEQPAKEQAVPVPPASETPAIPAKPALPATKPESK